MYAATYRVTLAVCLVAALVSVTCAALFLPTVGAILVLALAQCAVYALIGAYAWHCREHGAGSGFVLAMAVLCVSLSGVILYLVSPQVNFGEAIFAMLFQYVQAAVAVVGCYFGFALVERRRLQGSNPGAAQGKIVVVAILVAGVAAITIWFLSSK
jgi:hypothetical protein